MARNEEQVQGWFTGQVPDAWFSGPPEIKTDREEILVVGALPDVESPTEASDDAKSAARAARIQRFREETREQRMQIAGEAEHVFQRKVSWGAVCGDVRRLFTTGSVPVMTRLRINQRAVLDTLVDAGVARTRSEALTWCVRLVGKNETQWLVELRDAFSRVEQVRQSGPDA